MLSVMANTLANFKSEKVNEIIKMLRGELFVEYAYDSQKFLLDSKKKFEELSKRVMGKKIRPVGGFRIYRPRPPQGIRLAKAPNYG